MPSFDQINYALRPGKNVERKLIAECIQGLQPKFNIQAYRYIGMGSMWFADFTLFHRLLRIDDLVSIERDNAIRAEFNRPYKCVRVEEGETTLVLPDLELGAKRTIIWLDYDSDLGGPVFKDLPIVLAEVESGSVLIVTLNAHLSQFSRPGPGGVRVPPVEALAQRIGRTAAQVPKSAVTKSGFPPYLADVLFDRAEHLTRVRSGGDLLFQPIFSFQYQDGAPMITIGGMVVDKHDAEKLAECSLHERFDYAQGRVQVPISVPPLTPKEKATLDRLFPSATVPSVDDVAALGFPLAPEQIEGYHRFYRFYPVFTEMLG